LVILAFMLASITADAKIPPLSPEQLERGADLIIEGTVHAVEADGEVTHDHC
jgi:hypothetical protein